MNVNQNAVWLFPIGLTLCVAGLVLLQHIDRAALVGPALIAIGLGCWLASIVRYGSSSRSR